MCKSRLKRSCRLEHVSGTDNAFSRTHISQDHLPLDRDHGQALKPKVRLIPKFEGCVSFPDVQQVLYADPKCIILVVAWLITDNHAGHERLGDP